MRKKTLAIVMLLMAVIFIGCSKGLDQGKATPVSFLEITTAPTTPDITQPSVSAHSPTGSGIALSTKVSVKFDENMLQSTVTSSTFQVTAGGVPVPGKVSYNFLTKAYTFTPDSNLSYLTDYTATISGLVTDKAGNTLNGGDYSWTFTTQDAARLPTPGFSPVSGTYDSDTVTIIYSGPTANIYFTTDTTDPSPSNGTLYDGNPISISAYTQIRAIACENPGYYDSFIATGDFSFHTGQPTLSYTGGTYHNDISVELFPPSGDPSALLFYEMTAGTISSPPADPPIPTTSSTGYTGPIDISGDYTVVKITAIAVASGKSDSVPLAATYTIDYYQTGTPTFSVPAGSHDEPQSVTISHDPGSTLIYTLDGSDPTDPMNPNLQTDVNNPVIAVDSSMVLTAYAVMSGWRDSEVASASYIINPGIDYINPNAASNNETSLSVLIRGERFDPAATVSLTDGVSTISPLTTSWMDSTALQCTFDLTGATAGYWSLAVTNPDTGTATLVDGFRMYEDPAGIVSWWKLDGDATDSAGPNDGNNSGAVTYALDRFGAAGGAAVNSSMSDYIQATATGLPTGSSPRTMMGWFRIDAMHTGENFLFGYGTGTKYFKIYVNSLTNRLVLSEDGMDILAGTTALTTGRWYHVAATYDGTTAQLYLDGMAEGSTAATFATSAFAMYLFKVGALFPWLNGALDDVMVLSTVLSQSEVQQVAANGGYLLPPVNLQASKTYVTQIVLTWNPMLNATGYDVFRSTSLLGTYTQINAGAVTDATYTDAAVSAGTLYYYKVRAVNSATSSDLTKAEVGYTYGTLTTLTEGFEWTIASWWDVSPTQPVVTGSTGASFGSTPPQYDGYSQMTVASSTTCTGGCGHTESLALTKTFAAPISYFTLSLYYIFTPGADVGGNFSVYVNNIDPSDDPAYGLAPFAQELKTGGWWQRNLFYMGDNDIDSVTIIFYDLTDTAEFNVDLLKLNYK